MNIYVGNLAAGVSEQELNDLFSEYGEIVSVRIITDRVTGEPRGFGFVEMTSKEDGEKAIAALNQHELKGQAIVVNEARPKADRERSGGNFRRGGGGGRPGGGGPRGFDRRGGEGRGHGGPDRRGGGGGYGGGGRRGGGGGGGGYRSGNR